MTKEEIIDNIARLNSQTWRDREEVRTEIGKLLSELKKALEQPTIDKAKIHTLVEENEKLKADNKILAENCLKDLITCHSSIILEQQPCDDCVFCSLPPVTPTKKWIPVSERLPKDRDWYLGIFKEHDTGWINPLPFVCDYVGKETKGTTKEFWILRGFTDTDNPNDYYKNLDCVAW